MVIAMQENAAYYSALARDNLNYGLVEWAVAYQRVAACYYTLARKLMEIE